MRLSELKGEQAVEAMADLMEPLSVLLTDKEVIRLTRENAPKLQIVRALLKASPKAVIDIIAIINQEDRETYNPNTFEITKCLIDFLNEPEVSSLFFSQKQRAEVTQSGSATEDTQAGEQ